MHLVFFGFDTFILFRERSWFLDGCRFGLTWCTICFHGCRGGSHVELISGRKL